MSQFNLYSNLIHQSIDKRIDILRRINQTGSIAKAAREANISYKAAWQAIETLSNITGSTLVEKVVGGPHGGGTRLTTQGQQLVQFAQTLQKAHEEILKQFNEEKKVGKDFLLSTNGIRLSFRNQIRGTLIELKEGKALNRLLIDIGGDNIIRVSITKESCELLNIRLRDTVLILAKATSIEIQKEPFKNKNNYVYGTVLNCQRNRRGGECILQLDSGCHLVGFTRSQHGLKKGDKAYAYLPAEHLAIALNN